MKVRCLALSLGLLVLMPSVLADAQPSPEWLELLGQLVEIEELGVDIDVLIENRLSPEQKIEHLKEDLELLNLEDEL